MKNDNYSGDKNYWAWQEQVSHEKNKKFSYR